MSERPEWEEHFYLDSQSNEFVCMTYDIRIRRSTDEVNDDPEAVLQKLNIDCRRTPIVDGPHIPPPPGPTGLHDLARRCQGLRIPFYVPVFEANPDDVDYMLSQAMVRRLVDEIGFELELFRRIIIRQLETTAVQQYDCMSYKSKRERVRQEMYMLHRIRQQYVSAVVDCSRRTVQHTRRHDGLKLKRDSISPAYLHTPKSATIADPAD